MTPWHRRAIPIVAFWVCVGFPTPGWALADIDGDGVDDATDVCPNTPPGIEVTATGRPTQDLDGDCDVDLHEVSMFQLDVKEPGEVAEMAANLTGPMPCVHKNVGGSEEIELRVVVRRAVSPDPAICALGTSESEFLKYSCVTLQVYALDTSEAQAGLGCVYFDIAYGSPSCPVPAAGLSVSDTFSEFQNGQLVLLGADEVGGCTNDAGVGVGEWALVATFDVGSPLSANCPASIVLFEAVTASSLFDGKFTANVGYGEPESMTARCWGVIYDIDGSGFIDANDYAKLLPCIGETAPFTSACENMDWDCSGTIDAVDKEVWFDTAWLKFVCGGGINVSDCQLGCEP